MPAHLVKSDIDNTVQGVLWHKYTVTAAQIATAGLTNNATLFTLPAKGVILAAHAQASTAFAGTGIVTLGVTLGDAGNNSRYLPSFTVLSTGLLVPASGIWIPSMSGTTAIKAYFTAVGANLSTLTQGSLDVYVCWTTLP